MKATQCFLSESVKFFRPVYDGRFGLTCVNETGYDPTAPCVFLGIYRTEDLARFFNHQGKRIILWFGADAQKLDVVKTISLVDKVKHISTSCYIDHVLKSIGVDPFYTPLPMTIPERWVNPNAPPAALGNKVYCYAPNEVYGRSLAKEVAKNINFEMLLTDSCKHYAPEELKKMYEQSFIGIRLRDFDGIAASVQEMGLMGRRSVWNGQTPSAIKWNTLEDVVTAINNEAFRIGKSLPAVEVSKQVQSWICNDDSWLEV